MLGPTTLQLARCIAEAAALSRGAGHMVNILLGHATRRTAPQTATPGTSSIAPMSQNMYNFQLLVPSQLITG